MLYLVLLQPWADGEEGLIESEAEKGEIRSDGGNYGATGGSEDQVFIAAVVLPIVVESETTW